MRTSVWRLIGYALIILAALPNLLSADRVDAFFGLAATGGLGIIVAASSSVFIAAPILLFLGDWRRSRGRKLAAA